MNDTPTTNTAELEQRIRQWMQTQPDRAHIGDRMLVQLSKIKREFDGSTATRLEMLVLETLERQIRIDETRKAGLTAAKRLAENVQNLTEAISECLVRAEKAHGAVRNAMDTIAKHAATNQTMGTMAKHVNQTMGTLEKRATGHQTISYIAPALPKKAIDRKLMN